jgi:hypothetical protein
MTKITPLPSQVKQPRARRFVEGFDPFLFWLLIVAPAELIHSQVPDENAVCAQTWP